MAIFLKHASFSFRRRPFAFTIECLDGTTTFINPNSESGAQKWLQILRSVIFHVEAPSFITEESASKQDISEADENENIFQGRSLLQTLKNQNT